ncbi:hypothetical protein ACHAXA_000635 [Cyclostephanos tholiformis]|uniref:BRCT domain-containing protein n=1 Tax=Cyclostephanos tholiformis TaxID=382380 RepID=A0ABD3SQD5_9STRA
MASPASRDMRRCWSKLEYGLNEDTTEGNEGNYDILTGHTSENDSEEELLSQIDSDGCHPVKFLLSQGERSDASDSDGSETDISKTQPYPIPSSALKESSPRSLSSFDDEDDDDSTDCLEVASSSLPESPVNGNLSGNVPDDDTRQLFSAKPLGEENDTIHENRIVLENANGTKGACATSSVGSTEMPEMTPGNVVADESVLPGDPPEKEATHVFFADKPHQIDEIHKNHEDDEDDKAYDAETQIDDDGNDIYQVETQTLSFMPIYSENSSYPNEACGPKELSKDVGNDDLSCIHADTKEYQSGITEQAETSIDEKNDRTCPTVLPSIVSMGVRFVPPQSNSSSFLENGDDGQAEEGLQRLIKPPERTFTEQTPVQLQVAFSDTTVCQTDSNNLSVDQVIGFDTETRDHIVVHSTALQQKPICDKNADECVKCRDSILYHSIPHYGTHFKNDHDQTPTKDRFTRRRGISPFGRHEGTCDVVRIMFTGLVPTRQHKQFINDIGAQLIESIEEASTATHIIASDGKTRLRRTPKLMICICKTSRILSIQWLEKSAREQRVLNPDDFLLLDDTEAEKIYNFSMKETLENGKVARLERGGVLGGWYVYLCPGVAGNNAPTSEELNLVVEATGATLLPSLSESDVPDPTKTIVITSDPSSTAQRSEKSVKRVARLGAYLLTTSHLFHVIITQKFSTEAGQQPHSNTIQRSKRKAVLQIHGDMVNSSHKRKSVQSLPSHGKSRTSSRKR